MRNRAPGEFAMSGPLTPDQCRRYKHEGILFPLPVLSGEEVQLYRAECDDLETQLGGKPRTIEVRQMHLHFPWACTRQPIRPF